MKKTFKRQSKMLNSKSKKRTMKAMKGGAGKPVYSGKPVGDSGKPGKPSYNSRYGKSFGELTSKYSTQISELEEKISRRTNIMNGKTGIYKRIEQVRKNLQNPKLSETQINSMYAQLESLKDKRNLEKEQAEKETPLEVMKATLANLQKKQEKQMAKKKPSKAEALKIMEETLRLLKK